MSPQAEHPAVVPGAAGKVCADARCATLLDADAEICDECGGTEFRPLEQIDAMLCGWAGARPVVFALHEDRPSIVGRSTTGGPTPDVDLRRFDGSEIVHRRHAQLEMANGEWRITHLGTNPLVVTGRKRVEVEPGATVRLRSGDKLQVGELLLEFVARSPRRM